MTREIVRPRQVFLPDGDIYRVQVGSKCDTVVYGEAGQKGSLVNYHTFRFENLPKEKQDGCMVFIEPGGSTPLQFIKRGTFLETPLRGDVIVTIVDGFSVIQAYRCTPSETDSVSFELHPGMMVSLHAVNKKGNSSIAVEYEEPAFGDPKGSMLSDISRGADRIHCVKVPPVVWKFQDELSRGVYTCNCVEIVDLNKLEQESA